jgi:hypothetical protein
MIEDSEWLVPSLATILNGSDKFVGLGLDASVGDFWQFALGDLRMNNARGYLAEFIVGKALGLERVQRVEWDPYDILFDDITIEVKSSAYLQSWDQRKRSIIEFTGLKGTRWSPRSGEDPAGPDDNAMVYVFCVQTAQDHDSYDQLDLNQWEFYVLPRSALETLRQKSMRLSTVKALTETYGGSPDSIGWADLRESVTLASIGQRRDASSETMVSVRQSPGLGETGPK